MNKFFVFLLLTTTPIYALSEANLSAEFSIGLASQQVKSDYVEADSDTTYGFKLRYSFYNYFSAHIEYRDYGETENPYKQPFTPLIWNVDSKSKNFGIGIVYPIMESFLIGADFGVADWDMNIRANSGNLSGNFSADGTDPYYRFKMINFITERITFGLEYTDLDMKLPNGNIEIEDVSLLMGIIF